MQRQNQMGSWEQLPLALNLNASLESMSVLRAAYSRLALSRRLSFEQVMSDRALAIGIRHLADQIARRGALGSPTTGSSTFSEVATGADAEYERDPENPDPDIDQGNG